MDKKGHFTFADNKSRYQAGEDVSGIVRFTVKALKKENTFKICLICVSEVMWVEPIPCTRNYSGTYTCQDQIMLLKETFPLPKEYESLSEGEHEVPFTFKLPETGIPSSFVGPHGSIKYFIEVLNETDGNEAKKLELYEFKVDVPSNQNLNLSIGCSKEKDFGLLSLASGKINLYAGFKKKGCAPGESIELHVTVNNQSSVDVTPRAILYQIQVYKCERGHKALQIPISDPIVGKKVDKQTNFTENLFIPVPRVTPFTIKSPLISVKYFVHVTLDIPHAFDIHVNIPVVITKSELIEEFPTFIPIK